ncbi:uncharacterized protein [Miscanthus floridulus]|uniref:uncharacterized protein n=1 Tax=Miscanthus floridulus TaxID=154761 RepID=UPI0034590ADA
MVPLLGKAMEQVNKIKEKHEATWKQYGCTLMSDGWTDSRHLINFLVNSPEGTFFLESVDASSEVHDAPMLTDLLQQRIDLIGGDKVVQVVTNNDANYKAACKLLMERIPTLFWTPCATHCLDLMLEDISKMKEFSKPIARARQVTTFIYRHGRLLDAMREKTGGRDLVRPGVTRFATAFLTLRSLHTHKDALKFLFVSDDWTKSKLARTEARKKVHDTILSTEFWNSVEDCLRASQPLIVLLRIVDGDERPAMLEVQFCMEYAKKKIKENFPIREKADLLKHDVMAGKLRSAFTEVLSKMVPDQDLQNKIDDQALEYEDLRGSFSNKIAINNIKIKSPIEWWRSYGGKAVELQRFAKRVVGLCASASGCERCWSTFESIHTKKRNRLEHKRLNDLVYVQYNRKMAVRFQKRHEKGAGSFDPLCLEDFDWNNEWEDEDMKDDNSDEEYLIDNVEVDDYGEIAPIVADESDQAAAGGGNSDPFVMEDDFY